MTAAVQTTAPTLATAGTLLSAVHRSNRSRPCVHLLGELPAVVLLRRDALGRLNFQPRITAEPSPVIAARAGAVLAVSFDCIGPMTHRSAHHGLPDGRLRHTFRYKLDAVEAGLVIGELIR
jgi:hypothetical protein